ncbi:hypothetical protein N657DRAFT_672734 [Parathielavia appendiculata]|uniref:Uncharacterized protein n=1 Tax=Parathielavia appendiculata TaxID=2587402 RepID=A0AAN6TX16_9PEZI|nr:hypothetical protein N657DRAFT_672734 [Parathielavia appendiculata]
MAELDDRFSDDSSSEMSLTPSQSASQSVSQSSGSFTTYHTSAATRFPLCGELEVQLPKIWIHGKPYIKTEWLHKKRKRRSKVDEYGERYVKLDRENRSLGEYWLCNLCVQQGKTSLYATTNGATTNAKSHLQKDHRLLIGIESSDGGNGADDLEPSSRRQKTLQESLRKALVAKTTVTVAPTRDNKDLLQELLPYNGDTVRAWMKAEFETEKEYALLGITVHFVDHSLTAASISPPSVERHFGKPRGRSGPTGHN